MFVNTEIAGKKTRNRKQRYLIDLRHLGETIKSERVYPAADHRRCKLVWGSGFPHVNASLRSHALQLSKINNNTFSVFLPRMQLEARKAKPTNP